jgi:hypothetical protein
LVAPPTLPPAAAAPVAPNGDGLWLGGQPAPVEPAPTVSVQPEPVQSVEPVAPVQQPEPVQELQQPVAAPVDEPAPMPEAPVVTHVPEPDPVAEQSWGVVLRLANDERLELGTFAGEAEAMEHARGVVAQVSSQDGWPFVSGRFIRPDAIVSVDLVELEVSKWLGSSLRASALAPQASS